MNKIIINLYTVTMHTYIDIDNQSLKRIREEDEKWKLGKFMSKFALLAKYSI